MLLHHQLEAEFFSSFLPTHIYRKWTAEHTESRSSDEQRSKDDGDLHGEIEQIECDGLSTKRRSFTNELLGEDEKRLVVL
jgi:hypothetical protein